MTEKRDATAPDQPVAVPEVRVRSTVTGVERRVEAEDAERLLAYRGENGEALFERVPDQTASPARGRGPSPKWGGQK